MGMAASQARLLTITARLADNELKSQTINNAKMRLATQSSQASEDYINALNNATLKFTNYDETGATQSQALSYNALTSYSSYNTQYGLVNSSGQILVSESEAQMFENANGDLNKYLEAHGLEYSTTYFDNLDDLENNEYPAPFNNVTTDSLKQWYEEYNTYQTSYEVETYENSVSKYNTAYQNLKNALKDNVEEYFNKNVSTFVGTGLMNNKTTDYLAEFKKAWSAKYDTAKTQSFVSDSWKEQIDNYLSHYKTTNVSTNEFEYTDELSCTGDETNGYTIGGNFLTINKYDTSWTVQINDASEKESLSYSADSKNKVSDSTGLLTIGIEEGKPANIAEVLNYLTYKVGNDDKQTEFTYSYNKENNTVTERHKDTLTIDILDAMAEDLKQISVSCVNYTTLAELFTDGDSTNDPFNLTKEESEYVTEYNSIKENFFKLLFKTDENDENKKIETIIQEVEKALSDEDKTVDDLNDVDFVLTFANKYGIELSSQFDTVVKSYFVDEIVEEYGEPKYAWVDSTDTQNTGNADSKAQWYTNLFNRMQQGYKTLENGLATSTQWLEYALESGIVTMEQVDKSYAWNSLDYKSCTRITEETDDAAVAKAEAEYNRAMNDIESKDNIYDIQLKNIDTEHTALQTEYDSIKTVISKNIDRNFKFNQSA